jgi:glycosyltransferase involved in cell wall biosynthesis
VISYELKIEQSVKMMKILFIGNHDNINRNLAGYFHKLGYHVQHFLTTNELKGKRSSLDWEGGKEFPSYTTVYTYHKWYFFRAPKELVKAAQKADLVISNGISLVWALALDKPVIVIPSGSDITQTPFLADSFFSELRSFLLRKRKSNIAGIFSSQDDVKWASYMMAIGERWHFYQAPIDIESIRKEKDLALIGVLENEFLSTDFVFFLPSRKNLAPGRVDYKGYEKVARAITRFKSSFPDIKFVILSIAHGVDNGKFEAYIDELGLSENLKTMKEVTHQQLRSYLSIEKFIVFDQFHNYDRERLTLGGIARESLTLGRVLISHVNTEANAFKAYFKGKCPLYQAVNDEEIYRQIVKATHQSRSERERYETSAKEWVEENFHWRANITWLADITEKIIQKS